VIERLPVFALNTVLFPGVTLPLHVFEDRYRALVHHLLTISDKSLRLFAVVAIREGYEVGEHGVQSLHRIGTVAQMTSVAPHADGRFDIEVVGRSRMRLGALDTSEPYLIGEVEALEDPPCDQAQEEVRRGLEAFSGYRRRLAEMRGEAIVDATLPRDPTYLSYTLAASCPLPLLERQALLEAPDARQRLILLRHALREEARAMRAIPSLPATEVARTGWCPN
jgi:Lon protease-like protein